MEAMTLFGEINPPELGTPRGFNHGLVVQPGWNLLFVAGQTATGPDGEVQHRDFASQFSLALDRTLAIVRAAGAAPEHVVRMTVFVTDMTAYRESRPYLTKLWRERMGRHYPVMALVAVSELVDRNAVVEIEATAAFPPASL
jgi:enamine deaminase RidA (YjgF/YER057c/UK114 family)